MKKTKTLLAPSLLAADFTKLAEQIAIIEKSGADWLHLDVMDGQFVPPITFGDLVCKAASTVTKLPLDVHLMIVEPERQIDAFAAAGAQYLTVHVEACAHLHRVLQTIRSAGMKAGVSLNPGTPVEVVEPVLDIADLVLVMSVNPGWGAQKYLPLAEEKIRKLATWRKQRKLSYLIEIDGGIYPDTAKLAVAAGVDVLVAGTAVFKGDIAKNIHALKKALVR